MVVGVRGNGGEVILTYGPEDDGGLHQRVRRLSAVVCSARAAAVVRYLKNIALELALIHSVADVEDVTRCVARDDGGG